MKSFVVVISSLFVASLAIAGCGGADPEAPSEADNSATEQDVTSTTQCKGLLPHNCQVCADGTTACAHWAVVNKKCVIQTCAPAPAPAPVTSPSQCKGFLPQNCQVCSDGATNCAHWTVKNGACAIETCPSAPECVVASDCHGALPAFVVVCKDGTRAGAHHVCNAGVCGIETCQK